MHRRSRPAVVLATALLTAVPAGRADAAVLVASWQMNDTGAVMSDSSGNGNQGILKNVATNGSTFGFRGLPSVVSVKHSAGLNPGAATFTASARIRFAAPPSTAIGDYDLVRKGLAGTVGGHWKMEIVQSGKGYCLFKGLSGRVVLTAGPNLADNAWHTVTCQRAGSTVTLTVDGTAYVKSGPTGTIANTSPVYVGAKTLAGGDQFTGDMDYVTLSSG